MLSSNYKHLYAKYKSKYLKLKKQLGGSREYYQPCEITRLTTELFINKIVMSILNLQAILQTKNEHGHEFMEVPVNSNGSATYCQDPAIFLKKNSDGYKYAINVLDTLDLSSFNKIDVRAASSNDYGGNFITSPESTLSSPNGTIFCFSGISGPLQSTIQTYCMQNLVQLECGFRNQGERHIDECMCFMPYGPGAFKIWIYYIRNITLSEGAKLLLDRCSEQEKNEVIQLVNWLEQNYPMHIEHINKIKSGDFNLHELPLPIRNKLTSRHIKCIKEFTSKIDQRIAFISDLQGIWTRLETERQANLEKIARNIYSSSYAETSGNFVSFPLDLELDTNFNGTIDFKITNVPIFNRVWYETATNVKVLFSIGNAIDPEVQGILARETPHVKSIHNLAKPINYHLINTNKYNEDGRVGGNLHCLIKSVL